MTRLKDSHLDKWTNDQLVNYLNRLQSKLDEPRYKIIGNQVFAYNQNMQTYAFECDNRDRRSILDCICRSWDALSI